MAFDSWSGERFWVEVIENELYPPEAITLPRAVDALVKDEDFRGKKVLDYACGTGRFGKLVQDRGAEVIGIDISDEILKTASRVIKVKQADGTSLPFEDGSFDYVLSFMSLHIISDLEKAVYEISRVLKPHGRLLLGIVHPHSEKWDIKTGLAVQDNSIYKNIEHRTWVFNVTDGRKFEEVYIHRPLEHYFEIFSKFFTSNKLTEPQLPAKYYGDEKYARIEYLLGALMKNNRKQ